MRVLHVIPYYPPTKAYTGPPTSLHRLCKELIAQGVEVRVATTNDDGVSKLYVVSNRWIEYEGVPVFYGNRWGLRGDFAPDLHRCIQEEAVRADLVHAAPIFSWSTLSASRACRRAGKPLVVSPRGSFAPEALAWRPLKKRAFMKLGGRRAFERVDAFHATSLREEEDIGSFFPKALVGIVPNGVEVPGERDLARFVHSGGERTVLYLGRLHPHKNLDILLLAWARVAPRFQGVQLVLAGPGEDHVVAKLKQLAKELTLGDRIHIGGLVQGEEKSQLLARALVLVLPSKSENFGNVVAEALAHGTPVIASLGTPWEGVQAKGCGWWVEAREEPLADALGAALFAGPEALSAMGRAGREWMRRDFAWPAVAARMKEFYRGILNGFSSIPR